MHLWCRFYVSRPLFGEAQLDGLQAVINELLQGVVKRPARGQI
jgi:hypothetical protein